MAGLTSWRNCASRSTRGFYPNDGCGYPGTFAQFARPLTVADRRNLERQTRRPELSDVQPVIAHLLRRGLKLEQEAIAVE